MTLEEKRDAMLNIFYETVSSESDSASQAHACSGEVEWPCNAAHHAVPRTAFVGPIMKLRPRYQADVVGSCLACAFEVTQNLVQRHRHRLAGDPQRRDLRPRVSVTGSYSAFRMGGGTLL